MPSILRLLLLLFSSFSYVLHEYVHPFSFAAAPSTFSTFFLRLLFQRLPQRFSEMMVFSSSSFILLRRTIVETQPNSFRGSNHHILSLLHLSSTKGQTSAAFHQLTKKKIFFSRLCQSPFLHPWPFFVFDYGRLTPLAFLLSYYHHLSTYYLREEKSTIITW